MTRAERLFQLLDTHGPMTGRRASELLDESYDSVCSMLSSMRVRGLIEAIGVGRYPDGRRTCAKYAIAPGIARPRPQGVPVNPVKTEPRRVQTVRVPEHQAREPLRYVTIGRERLAVTWDGANGGQSASPAGA